MHSHEHLAILCPTPPVRAEVGLTGDLKNKRPPLGQYFRVKTLGPNCFLSVPPPPPKGNIHVRWFTAPLLSEELGRSPLELAGLLPQAQVEGESHDHTPSLEPTTPNSATRTKRMRKHRRLPYAHARAFTTTLFLTLALPRGKCVQQLQRVSAMPQRQNRACPSRKKYSGRRTGAGAKKRHQEKRRIRRGKITKLHPSTILESTRYSNSPANCNKLYCETEAFIDGEYRR